MHLAPSFPEHLIRIAKQAGQAILDIYHSDTCAVREKDDKSPLTAADLAAHACITEGLTLEFPNIPILSEEAAAAPWLERRHWHTLFLVDPLDGTKEFLKRNGEFTVNIALIRGGVPIAGVVHAPVQNRTWYTCGNEARLRDSTADRKVRAQASSDGPARIVASRSHADEVLESFLDACPPHQRIPMGSSLKLCLVADGSADLYPRLAPTMEWDTAAAHAICTASGATVTDTQGTPLTYNKPNLRNPHFVVAAPDTFLWQRPLSESGYSQNDS